MTRAEVLAQYRPIRAGIQRVLRRAADVCSPADLTRAARQAAPRAEEEDLSDEAAADMLTDVALFEPNQRGRRAFVRFLAQAGERLSAADRALAERMAGARFSVFRVAGRHEAAGLRLEDLLEGDRRLWLARGRGVQGFRARGRHRRHAPIRRGAVPCRLRHHRGARCGDARPLLGGRGARRAPGIPPFARRHALWRPAPGRCAARARRHRPAADPVRDPHLGAHLTRQGRAEEGQPPATASA